MIGADAVWPLHLLGKAPRHLDLCLACALLEALPFVAADEEEDDNAQGEDDDEEQEHAHHRQASDQRRVLG